MMARGSRPAEHEDQMESIYVEILIRAPFEDVWRATQTPSLHQRWDARFTLIEYLPRPDSSQPQQFCYRTRIGLGVEISGAGESVGERRVDGTATSALKFWSDDPRSLIREGSGYWQYVKVGDDVRFLTLYDYRTRFGAAGALLDRAFRPLMGWVTAWSFDRLRLWLERGLDPGESARRAIVEALSRVTLAFVWIYHGLVPKLLVAHQGELEFLRRAGLFQGQEQVVTRITGAVEVIVGAAILLLWRWRGVYAASAVAFATLSIGAVATIPEAALAPFNPVSLTFALLVLCAIGRLSSHDLPRAGRCRCTRPRSDR